MVVAAKSSKGSHTEEWDFNQPSKSLFGSFQLYKQYIFRF